MCLSSISLGARPKTSITQGPIRNEFDNSQAFALPIDQPRLSNDATTVVSSYDRLRLMTSEHVTVPNQNLPQGRTMAQHSTPTRFSAPRRSVRFSSIYGSTKENEDIIVDYEPSHEARGRAFMSTLSRKTRWTTIIEFKY